ncbi:6-phosphogluconolactonase [Cyanobium sp. Morenito 9A2]|uniref:6-phosphogluconolactonase n=1 Tax=Cyanobium sp. Morenito 9A2 TaxID=2823718 RepID=UPI0020CEDBFD|nr:6-phosphogluconolactonase [Cyanobium sp. Morenito 9A2]MCP9850550.1 6-phosphogluconolactonase [Cyanobium sp. Morenito 9A2]
MSDYLLQISEDPASLAQQASTTIATAIDLALAQRERAQIALSGGTTPAEAYRQLGRQHLPWERVDVLLGDERWVAEDDPASNALMLRETLLAEPPGQHACFHPVPTGEATPELGAAAFSHLLRQLCPGQPPVFDLILLGLGDDGHTASLFPHTKATQALDRTVTVGLGKGLARISLTAPVLSAARQVVFLVAGEGKRQALARLLDPVEPSERTPARLVQPAAPVLVLADRAAAGGLEERDQGQTTPP